MYIIYSFVSGRLFVDFECVSNLEFGVLGVSVFLVKGVAVFVLSFCYMYTPQTGGQEVYPQDQLGVNLLMRKVMSQFSGVPTCMNHTYCILYHIMVRQHITTPLFLPNILGG